MILSVIPSLLLAFVLQTSQISFQQLLGSWQLVHFESIDQLRNSPQYRNSDAAMREGLEYKIQNRLENTVYNFVAGDSLKYTDYVSQEVVQRQAKIEISKDSVMTIHTATEIRQAKIVEFSGDRMVLAPISNKAGAGKLVFERIK
ncbi:hypothetical protein J2X69_004922 [Algoriphagus sp. 4150]|uniref:hypothetical protein n=1 Tax=Algoriphagus sp. 4150 TaxID=2817756 RepID=UPI0028579009|nr:hypothetical protein [Algoriphagus sp. 4150]MDR7132549.1 hypothetical protein [Algoriphagus sp. 4150]